MDSFFQQHGVFATEDDHYVIEHLLNGGRAADGYDHIVYKKSAIKSKHNESHCGVEDPSGTTTHWWMSQSSLGDVHTTRARRHGNHQHKDKWRETPRRRSRRSVSKENTVELLVVVDKTMVGYHGSSEIEPYILTVMNIVANLYHDVSIGNYMNIVVTRLVLLTEDQWLHWSCLEVIVAKNAPTIRSDPRMRSAKPVNEHNTRHKPVNEHNTPYKPVNEHNTSYKLVNEHNTSYKPVNEHNTSYKLVNEHNTSYKPVNEHNTSYKPVNEHNTRYKPTYRETTNKRSPCSAI
ncbi:A disintegrin and metalloproteinase with thrombospondin motifs 6 [Lamellibrachia satsuma]|nr:A disintegrin and metalloproteinase with thrombospondin motifs 6 [Lamellibrachia satsuma]